MLWVNMEMEIVEGSVDCPGKVHENKKNPMNIIRDLHIQTF